MLALGERESFSRYSCAKERERERFFQLKQGDYSEKSCCRFRSSNTKSISNSQISVWEPTSYCALRQKRRQICMLGRQHWWWWRGRRPSYRRRHGGRAKKEKKRCRIIREALGTDEQKISNKWLLRSTMASVSIPSPENISYYVRRATSKWNETV